MSKHSRMKTTVKRELTISTRDLLSALRGGGYKLTDAGKDNKPVRLRVDTGSLTLEWEVTVEEPVQRVVAG